MLHVSLRAAQAGVPLETEGCLSGGLLTGWGRGEVVFCFFKSGD